jgi:hypothetical protein
MSKPDAPSPPDYTGAAQQTGQSNIYSAIIQQLMSHTNQNTPWGSLQWNQTGTQHVGPGGAPLSYEDWHAQQGSGAWPLPGSSMPDSQAGYQTYLNAINSAQGQGYDIPIFSSTVELSPEQQAIFEQQQANQLAMQQAAGGITGNIETGPLDFSGLPSLPNTGDLEGTRRSVADAIYGRQSRYLDPQFAKNEEAERTRLANQGFQVGTEGFGNALEDFNMAKQRAYADARDAALAQAGTEMSRDFGIGLQGRQQGIAEILARRNQPINELSALMGGTQVSMPQFMGGGGVGGIPGTDYLGAAGQGYNAALQGYGIDSAQYNSQMGGLYGLGSLALLYAMSDRRLKRDIHRIGTHPLGIGIYSYTLFERPTIGVMADEVEAVLPEAVAIHPSGYKMVNYSLLLTPETVA